MNENNMKNINITHPWVIIHQTGDTVQTILMGPNNAPVEAFALCAADLIRHIANATGVKEPDVFDLVIKELNNPTSNIKRVCNA